MMKAKKTCSLLAVLTAAAMFTACGATAASDSSASSSTGEVAATAAPAASAAATAESAGVTYPITIPHAYGETVIEAKPERVAAIGWGNGDVPLALGVVPVGVSMANFGAVGEDGLLPWTSAAFTALGEDSPVVYDDTDGLDFEAISDSDPDVILAAYSGITQEEYDTLSQIAPVVAYPESAWQTYWRQETLMNGEAMGMKPEAEALVADTEALIADKLAAHPALEGKTAAFLWVDATDFSTFYVYLPTDPRANFLLDLGFTFPENIEALNTDPTAFSITMSAENVDALMDLDIIVAYGDDAVLKAMQADPLMGTVPAVANGAVVMLPSDGALSASSNPTVLSIPDTLDDYLALLNTAAENIK